MSSVGWTRSSARFGGKPFEQSTVLGECPRSIGCRMPLANDRTGRGVGSMDSEGSTQGRPADVSDGRAVASSKPIRRRLWYRRSRIVVVGLAIGYFLLVA